MRPVCHKKNSFPGSLSPSRLLCSVRSSFWTISTSAVVSPRTIVHQGSIELSNSAAGLKGEGEEGGEAIIKDHFRTPPATPPPPMKLQKLTVRAVGGVAGASKKTGKQERKQKQEAGNCVREKELKFLFQNCTFPAAFCN